MNSVDELMYKFCVGKCLFVVHSYKDVWDKIVSHVFSSLGHHHKKKNLDRHNCYWVLFNVFKIIAGIIILGGYVWKISVRRFG